MTDNEKLFLYQAVQTADKWHTRYRQSLNLSKINKSRINECYRNWKDAEENLSNLLYHLKKA